MSDNEQKAMQLLAEAKKKSVAPKGFLTSFFGSSKAEEAVECYQRAANLLKMSKKWKEAGNAFCNSADLHVKAGNRHDAATSFIDAANCFKKLDASESVECLLKAIEIYTDMGRFTTAAKHHQSIAEIYENEVMDLERCIQHYERAADYFRGEESNSSANKCSLKVAQYAAQLEDYGKAIQIYEQVALESLGSSLLKYSAKEYYFRAALCHLCVDVLNAQHATLRYQDQFPAFQDSREFKLIMAIIDSLEEQNLESFTETVKEYDSISRLDQWYTTILLRIKKQINNNPDLR